jgi:predicted PurR-regulated permease PerM
MPGVSAFVVLALVLAVLSLAIVVVVVRELLRNVRKLTDQVKATTQRLVPLTDELQAELAVTSVEVEGLTRSMERLQKERATNAARKRAMKPGGSKRSKRKQSRTLAARQRSRRNP